MGALAAKPNVTQGVMLALIVIMFAILGWGMISSIST
jgi:hypothetical protein